MKSVAKCDIYACDFETSVYDGQEKTEVWASGFCQLGNHENMKVWNNIDDFMRWGLSLNGKSLLYFHNLKFDGSFIVNWLLAHEYEFYHGKISDMRNNQFSATISNMGQWYKINLPCKKGRGSVEIRDSLKILPFSLRKLTNDFDVKHKKLELEYTGERHAGYIMDETERAYFENDLLGLAEVLEEIFARGVDALTIGSECLKEYKNTFDINDYKLLFPDLTEYETPEGETVENFCRASYRGGWCYVNPIHKKKLENMGYTLDVNSLYPSRMHSESNCYYPVGKPYIITENISDWIRTQGTMQDVYYFVRLECIFNIKKNHLPTIQIHNNKMYNPRQYQTTSRTKGNKYYYDSNGNIVTNGLVVLTLTKTDFELMQRQYNITHLRYIEVVAFQAVKGIFDIYLNRYRELKLNATNKVDRTLAKLYMNNLYGKMATSTDSSYKVPYLENGILKFNEITEFEKQAGYIAIGSAITAYAREFTITSAQANYFDFCYADTDSIHCIGKPENAKGVILHDKKFNCWKCENIWFHGWFVRAKSYIEMNDIDDYLIKCAGMPENCKQLLAKQFRRNDPRLQCCGYENLTAFQEGICVNGKLLAKQIKGGVLLVPTTFKFKA